MPVFLTLFLSESPNSFSWDSLCTFNNDSLATLISALGWIVSAIVLYYIHEQLRLVIKNRNLGFSSEADKMLIDNPELWEFYDSHVGKFSKRDDNEFRTRSHFSFDTKEILEIADCHGVTVTSTEKVKVCFYIGRKKMFERKVHSITFVHHGRARIDTYGTTVLQRDTPFTLRQFSMESRQLEAKLDAFTYFMLNHFEVILLEKNQATYPGWRRYMQYCMRKSERFRSKLEKIIEDDEDFRGLYGPRYIAELKKMKLEYETKNDA